MVASSPFKGALLLALGGLSQRAAAACTRTITAQPGDSCASLARAAGITMTDFLRSNPDVYDCNNLIPGYAYCVQGVADPGSGGSQPISKDGRCGGGVTCSNSGFGDCCSQAGYCGSTLDHCGTGCQPQWGVCLGPGGGSSSSSARPSTTPGGGNPGGPSTVTVTVTRTTGASTITTTRTVSASATTSTVRLTSIVTSVSTITSVSTSTRLVTATTCVGSPTTVRTTATPSPTGRPIIPGTPTNCWSYDQILTGDSCRSLAQRNGLTLLDFYAMNPQIDCDRLQVGWYVCVRR